MRKKGFTLIELMIVISIIGILSMILVPKLNFMKNESKNEQLKANVVTVRNYLNMNKEPNKDISTENINVVLQWIDDLTDNPILRLVLKLIFYGYIEDGYVDVEVNKYVKSPQSLSLQLTNSLSEAYEGSRALKNSFTNNSEIVNIGKLNKNYRFNTTQDGAVLILYVDGQLSEDYLNFISDIPLPNTEKDGYFNNIKNANEFTNLKGKLVIIVHYNGYAGFAVDDKGNLVDPFVIKFDNKNDYEISEIIDTEIFDDEIEALIPSEESELEKAERLATEYLRDRLAEDKEFLKTATGNKEKRLMQHLFYDKPSTVNGSFYETFAADGYDLYIVDEDGNMTGPETIK